MAEPVVVLDPGYLPTTRQMALAVSDRLSDYYTAVSTVGVPRSLLGAPYVGAELRRRYPPKELRPHVHHVATAPELLRIASIRLGVRRLNYPLIWRRNILCDRKVARRVGGNTPIVVAHYGACEETFRAVRGRGGRTVLDYPIARQQVGQDILREEASLQPDFADSLRGRDTLHLDPRRLARLDREIENAAVIVVGSQFAAQTFEDQVDPHRLEVVPYGVDSARFHPAKAKARCGPLRVVFVGQLSQRKGLSYLLQAVSHLDPAQFELTLVGPVVGSGRGLARFAGTYRHVDAVTPHAMPEVYRQADVLVLPSLVEGSALVVLEAMASGLPVVVTPNAGADAVRDRVEGFVVPIRSPNAIAERLSLLRHDDELRVSMGVRARERVSAFGWTAFQRRFRAILDEKPG